MTKDTPRPRIAQFLNNFHLGGTEGQAIALAKGLLGAFDVHMATLHLEGAHLESAKSIGLFPKAFPLAASLASPITAWQVARLAWWLRGQGIVLIHAHDFYTSLIAVPAARLCGARVVLSRLDLLHWQNLGQRMALKAVTLASDHLIANAAAIERQVLRDELVSRDRITVIHNGIDLQSFDARAARDLDAPTPPIGDDELVIAHVANMNHEVKAQDLLIEVFSWLTPRYPEARLWLIGDGPRRPRLERQVAELGLARRIAFLGRRTDVPALLKRCHIGVLCSRAEGLSNAIIESMAAGLPMVVTDAGGNAELVANEERGFVVPIDAKLLLAARLEALLGSAQLRAQMGERARHFVERELGIERLIEHHAAVYRQVLDRPRRGLHLRQPRAE
ncbi:MAG: glycosyltransferase [Myxococcales bacterium]|jgi:glycosyltransferase involved in cell wall biosynthesis|nr:glycosyltransferase [Myxococcales bacterium]